MHRIRLRWIVCMACVSVSGGMTGGCPFTGALSGAADPNASLAGLWSLTRGTIEATCIWTVSGGGQVMETWNAATLQPLDPADFPTELQSLVQQWNGGLADLNIQLDSAFPSQVIVAFPRFGIMTLAAQDDPSRTIEGAIDSTAAYIFLTDVSGDMPGDAQGGGAVLQAATIQGRFDRAATTTEGYVARTLQISGSGVGGGGLALTLQIRIQYTGVRTGDASP